MQFEELRKIIAVSPIRSTSPIVGLSGALLYRNQSKRCGFCNTCKILYFAPVPNNRKNLEDVRRATYQKKDCRIDISKIICIDD